MNTLLGALLVLSTFLMSCSAQCYMISLEGSQDDSSNECKDSDGITHSMDSTWMTSNCYKCSCSADGIHCCNTAAIPVNYDKMKCVSYFHKNNCSYTVVERENPEKPCVVNMWIL